MSLNVRIFKLFDGSKPLYSEEMREELSIFLEVIFREDRRNLTEVEDSVEIGIAP